jgi:transglutaminase-like putative cysteine protease
MRGFDRMGIATALAVFLTSFTATPLTRDTSFLGAAWLLIGLIAGTGALLRRIRLGALAVLVAQVLLLIGFTFVLAAGMSGAGEAWYDHIGYLWANGIQHMQSQAAPMAPNEGVRLIFVTVLGVVMVVTDLLAIGIARPVWALGPIAAVFLVPAVGLSVDTGVMSFLAVAVGYLGILVADGTNTTGRWTRGLSRDSAEGFGTALPVVWRAAGLIGGPALVLTIVLGIVMPTLTLPGFGLGNGAGYGGALQLSDPTLDLRRNLNQPQNTPVLEYQSSDPNGEYLRLASLPQFSANGWTNVQMKLTDGRSLGTIPGAVDNDKKKVSTTIRILDLESEYLPLPYAPRSFNAPGNWAYDPNSLVVLSTNRINRGQATKGLDYTVQSVDTAPGPDDLANSGVGVPADADVTRAVPPDLPKSLIDLSQSVTADADSPAAKAAAIQAYLRSGRFVYSTQPQPGSGYQALENFLFVDHMGYCEQFAAAMAMMARVVGIPSRVAVGFLPGERRGDTWTVSVHNMHAWPELYFSGFGWVRYEPTPASVTGTAPSWTLPSNNQPTGTTSAEPSAGASASADVPSEAPTSDPSHLNPGDVVQAGTNWGQVALTAGIGLVLLVILAAPATIRVRRRTGRLSAEGAAPERVESAWAEIRDTVTDYGGRWPDGESPRAIGNEIAGRLNGSGSETMTQVATMVERSRYAQTYDDADGTRRLGTMTREIRRGIAAPQSRWRRIRAVLLPRSLFARRPRR